MKIKANGLDIEVEDSGHVLNAAADPGPAVLLIMGLGMQLIAWPPELVQGFVNAGYRVVRFDNRDIGLSTRFDAATLSLNTILGANGATRPPPYTLNDMAADAVGVLDALQIQKAHVVGVSMGGMIAQRMALNARSRLLSLTCIMSSSGATDLPRGKPEIMQAMLSGADGTDLQATLEHAVKLVQATSSPGFPPDMSRVRDNVTAAAARCRYPQGVLRQVAAARADGDRTAALAGLRAPTLVIHGKADPLIPFACGEDLARRIPGARLEAIDGMGHDLPLALIPRLLTLMAGHFAAHSKPEQRASGVIAARCA
ncbi:alpha/beta hydrolase [Paraburkholderia sediminicola]|uniref:alpha/beta fold hydrolase n=1 Tax=Paraburkholderia sediminicola TaxID=458836 RepID=UPI0038B97DFE